MITTAISLLFLFNAVRAQPLAQDPILDQAATIRADYLCAHHQWSHDGWLDSFKNIPYQFAGEDLAKDFSGNTLRTFNAWMASPAHKANIVKPQYGKVGFGYSKRCDISVALFTN